MEWYISYSKLKLKATLHKVKGSKADVILIANCRLNGIL